MQLSVVRQLVNDHDIATLQAAEAAILEGQKTEIEVEGVDEGEQLTHVMAAIWVLHEMKENNVPLNKAVRNYTVKVRNSIS